MPILAPVKLTFSGSKHMKGKRIRPLISVGVFPVNIDIKRPLIIKIIMSGLCYFYNLNWLTISDSESDTPF